MVARVLIIGGYGNLGGLIARRLARDWLHALIARNRFRWFGKTDHCALLTTEQRSRLL